MTYDHAQQIDHVEHDYWRNRCPECEGDSRECECGRGPQCVYCGDKGCGPSELLCPWNVHKPTRKVDRMFKTTCDHPDCTANRERGFLYCAPHLSVEINRWVDVATSEAGES